MKIENTVEISQYKMGGRVSGLKRVEADKFVDSVYDELKKLAGTKQGKIIDIQELGDEPWPSVDQYKVMDKESKSKISKRVMYKMRFFKLAVNRKMPHGFKFRPSNGYIGGGKVLFWWSFKRNRTVTKNGTTGSK